MAQSRLGIIPSPTTYGIMQKLMGRSDDGSLLPKTHGLIHFDPSTRSSETGENIYYDLFKDFESLIRNKMSNNKDCRKFL